jgi:phenylacetate-CoA ligase
LSPHFYIELTKADRMDAMTVNVEALPSSAAEEVRIGIAAQLQTLIKNNIGVTSIVHVLEPETIERSMGKAQRIVDNRPK